MSFVGQTEAELSAATAVLEDAPAIEIAEGPEIAFRNPPSTPCDRRGYERGRVIVLVIAARAVPERTVQAHVFVHGARR